VCTVRHHMLMIVVVPSSSTMYLRGTILLVVVVCWLPHNRSYAPHIGDRCYLLASLVPFVWLYLTAGPWSFGLPRRHSCSSLSARTVLRSVLVVLLVPACRRRTMVSWYRRRLPACSSVHLYSLVCNGLLAAHPGREYSWLLVCYQRAQSYCAPDYFGYHGGGETLLLLLLSISESRGLPRSSHIVALVRTSSLCCGIHHEPTPVVQVLQTPTSDILRWVHWYVYSFARGGNTARCSPFK
jgi:hypothetical protein